jgi:hypothetical protein
MNAQPGALIDITPVASCLEDVSNSLFGFPKYPPEFLISTSVDPESPLIKKIIHDIDEFGIKNPYMIWFDYVTRSAELDTLPYQFEYTCSTILGQHSPLPPVARWKLEAMFNDLVTQHLHQLNASEGVHEIDKILGMLLSFWKPDQTPDLTMARGIIQYLNLRTSDRAVQHVMWSARTELWRCIPSILSRDLGLPGISKKPVADSESLTALWRFCLLPHPEWSSPAVSVYESALHAVINSGTSPASISIGALLKARILKKVRTEF